MSTAPWTTISSLKEKLEKNYARGAFFIDWIEGDIGPFVYSCKVPTAAERNDMTDLVRSWRDTLFDYVNGSSLLDMESRTVTDRKMGEFTYPERIIFKSDSARLKFIGKSTEFEKFKILFGVTRDKYPQLVPWMKKYPMKLLQNKSVWYGILAFCEWMLANQKPDIYLREVPVKGIHTKFVGQNKGVISELLNELLPESAINQEENDFVKRYGFKSHTHPSTYITFRFLDDNLRQRLGYPYKQISAHVTQIAANEIPVKYVFVVENLETFEAFPDVPDSICIYGSGNKISFKEGLSTVSWLKEKAIYYFGDLDPSGFLILNRFREAFPQTKSFLMDMQTLKECEDLCVVGKPNKDAVYDKLTADEMAVVEAINAGPTPLLLEQERIPMRLLDNFLMTLCSQ